MRPLLKLLDDCRLLVKGANARLAVAVLECDPFLAAVGAHADQDEYAAFGVFRRALSQPGDRGRRQPGRAAEELLQRGREVAGGQSVQVEQRQHFADLRGLAAPRGRIAEEKRLRSPVTAPAAVVTFLGWW